ncbi:MAG: AraC family transcriptional regulator [Clostridia bacterium]|nr:AraC family transcriptional regulator [Clostridia bacterium]
MRKYFNYHVKKTFSVKNLVTIESLVFSSDFSYPEEVHDFYEFAYVDSGAICCNTKAEKHLLSQGDFFLILPQEPHFYTAVNAQAASVFVACFQCKSEFSEFIRGKNQLDKELKKIVADLLAESKAAFQFPFNKKLVLLEKPRFGAQQIIENKIEELLVKLVRGKIDKTDDIRFVMNSVEFENNLAGDILAMLKENVYDRIDLDYIAKKTFYSKTYINNIFKKNIGQSIMQYYTLLKMEEAKRLLKQGATVSAISDKLHFDSPNYFTKAFKKHTGTTPSQYKRKILE